MSDEAEVIWWTIYAGTRDEREGERLGRIRAGSEIRARELYLLQRPASWVIHEIRPATEAEIEVFERVRA